MSEYFRTFSYQLPEGPQLQVVGKQEDFYSKLLAENGLLIHLWIVIAPRYSII